MNSTSSERLPRTPDNSFPPHPYETDACERIQRFAKTGCFTLDLRQNSFKGQGAICDIFETASERCELPYSAFMEPVHPDDRSLMEELLSASGNAPHERRIDYRLLMPDGRIKHVTGLFNIRFDDSGQALNASGVLQDITALKTLQYENSMLQQLLMQQSKIAQMGEMIESIVHQWKQPLHQINAILPGLERHFSAGTLDSQRLALKLDEIEMLTTHMGQTVDSFRHFFRSDGPKALFCLADAAADVMRLLKRELERSGVEWELCAEGKHMVSGSETLFAQALLSILNNARECFNHRDVDMPKLRIDIRSTPAETTLTVSDNAGGIPEAYLNKIFDLYFTTKRRGHGTGLGLYIAKMLIEKGMQGTIAVENTQAGAAFTIYLPAGDAL